MSPSDALTVVPDICYELVRDDEHYGPLADGITTLISDASVYDCESDRLPVLRAMRAHCRRGGEPALQAAVEAVEWARNRLSLHDGSGHDTCCDAQCPCRTRERCWDCSDQRFIADLDEQVQALAVLVGAGAGGLRVAA